VTVEAEDGTVAPASGARVRTVAVTAVTRQVPASPPSMTCWPTTKPSLSQLPTVRVRVAPPMAGARVAVPVQDTVSTGATVRAWVLGAPGTTPPANERSVSTVAVRSTTCQVPPRPEIVTCWPMV
jgi:hypothetical protein